MGIEQTHYKPYGVFRTASVRYLLGRGYMSRSHYQRTRISTVQWRICRISRLCKILRIINPGFYTNISVNVRKRIKSHTESWRIVSLLVIRYSLFVIRVSCLEFIKLSLNYMIQCHTGTTIRRYRRSQFSEPRCSCKHTSEECSGTSTVR